MVYVVVHCLDPVAVFASRYPADVMARAIGGEVYPVPVLMLNTIDPNVPQGPTDGD